MSEFKQSKLKTLVEDFGLTYEELGRKVGLSKARIGDIVSGSAKASDKALINVLTKGLDYSQIQAEQLIAEWNIEASEALLNRFGIHRWETVQDQFVAVPILGNVSCGPFQDPEMQGEYLYPIDFLDRKHRYFCLRANGISMLGKIDPGDIVLIEECQEPMPGKVMLFCHGEDVALGYLYEHEGYFEIKKANRDFPPILINDPSFQIKGWVKSVVKMRV